jgi:hypothetical protein
MPIITEAVAAAPGGIAGIVSAPPGWRADAYPPQGAEVGDAPPPSLVVAWALVADESAPGGGRVDPVFVADGRAWTPDQYRAAYGQQLNVRVARAQ